VILNIFITYKKEREMGKTYRKDGKNRNRFNVKKRKGQNKKPTNIDFEKMIEEYEEDVEKYEVSYN